MHVDESCKNAPSGFDPLRRYHSQDRSLLRPRICARFTIRNPFEVASAICNSPVSVGKSRCLPTVLKDQRESAVDDFSRMAFKSNCSPTQILRLRDCSRGRNDVTDLLSAGQ